ncbi:MAG: transposase [Dehalococcoidales bacterium]
MTGISSDIHHRRSIRLKGYDYSLPGAYFVTIITYQRIPVFGEIKAQNMLLGDFGEIAISCWEDIPKHYPNILLDSFIIMPNHVHGILIIDNVGAGLKPAPTAKKYPLSEIVRSFKTFSARRINTLRKTPGLPVWQRNYYAHIIRNEEELNSIREYIENNIREWETDKENPSK